jgi:DNA topoisomerase-3
MTDQIVITEKTSQAKDIRAAVGGRYGTILPAEGTCSTSSSRKRSSPRTMPGRKAVVREQKASAGKLRSTRPGKGAPELQPPDVAKGDTPLRIPFGNKEAALQLSARYRAGGWYAPAGVNLNSFRERGWL